MRRRILTTLAAASLLIVSGVLAGCSDDDDGGTENAAASCPAPTTDTPAASKVSIESGGRERTYHLWLPEGYDGTEPVPVVADFHGAGGTALRYADGFSTMTVEAPKRGYLVVAGDAIPQGADGRGGVGWTNNDVAADGSPPKAGTAGAAEPRVVSPDVDFTRAMFDSLAESYCIDRDRLYVTGFSSGASFAAYAGCTMPELAAVAPLAGLNLTRPCPDAPGMPMITMHGDADQAVFFTGFDGLSDPDDPTLNSFHGDVRDTAARWAARNGCDPTPVEEPTGAPETQDEAITVTYGDCADGNDVVVHVLKGADHLYPGGLRDSARLADDPSLSKVDGAATVLDFFDAHPGA